MISISIAAGACDSLAAMTPSVAIVCAEREARFVPYAFERRSARLFVAASLSAATARSVTVTPSNSFDRCDAIDDLPFLPTWRAGIVAAGVHAEVDAQRPGPIHLGGSKSNDVKVASSNASCEESERKSDHRAMPCDE